MELKKAWENPRDFEPGSLAKHILDSRVGYPISETPRAPEISVFLEAAKSPIYKAQIIHLMKAICQHPVPVDSVSSSTCHCDLCGTEIMYYTEWTEFIKTCKWLGEHKARNYLAYTGSARTKQVVCTRCLKTMSAASEVIKKLDPSLLIRSHEVPEGLLGTNVSGDLWDVISNEVD